MTQEIGDIVSNKYSLSGGSSVDIQALSGTVLIVREIVSNGNLWVCLTNGTDELPIEYLSGNSQMKGLNIVCNEGQYVRLKNTGTTTSEATIAGRRLA